MNDLAWGEKPRGDSLGAFYEALLASDLVIPTASSSSAAVRIPVIKNEAGDDLVPAFSGEDELVKWRPREWEGHYGTLPARSVFELAAEHKGAWVALNPSSWNRIDVPPEIVQELASGRIPDHG